MTKYDRYLAFDQPIPYKELLIYPTRIKDYQIFMTLASCLMLEKNSIKDPVLAVKAISMTYLEYLWFVNGGKPHPLFDGLLRLILGKFDDDEFPIYYGSEPNGRPLFKIGETIYNSSDFDEIKEIVATQNSLDLPDERIQKDVREKMEEARRFKERLNKSKIASFEEQMVALALYSGWDLEKMYNMTIRKFIMGIQRANQMIMSNIYLTASLSGFVTFKSKDATRGWLSDLEVDDKYSDVTMSLDSITKKVSGEEAKENKN